MFMNNFGLGSFSLYLYFRFIMAGVIAHCFNQQTLSTFWVPGPLSGFKIIKTILANSLNLTEMDTASLRASACDKMVLPGD